MICISPALLRQVTIRSIPILLNKLLSKIVNSKLHANLPEVYNKTRNPACKPVLHLGRLFGGKTHQNSEPPTSLPEHRWLLGTESHALLPPPFSRLFSFRPLFLSFPIPLFLPDGPVPRAPSRHSKYSPEVWTLTAEEKVSALLLFEEEN